MLFGKKKLEREYLAIVDQVLKKAQRQARSRRIDLRYEPTRVLQSIPFPGNTDGEDYWFVADYILAEYELELGLEVLARFNEHAGQLGFGPYGKVLVGVQYADRRANSEIAARIVSSEKHPEYCDQLIARKTMETTEFISLYRRYLGDHQSFFDYMRLEHSSERHERMIDTLAT